MTLSYSVVLTATLSLVAQEQQWTVSWVQCICGFVKAAMTHNWFFLLLFLCSVIEHPATKTVTRVQWKVLSHCRSWQKFANFTFCLIIEEWLFKETCIVLKRHRSIYLSSQKLFIFKQEEYTCWGPITSLSMKKFKGIFN